MLTVYYVTSTLQGGISIKPPLQKPARNTTEFNSKELSDAKTETIRVLAV
jgi:hypothetical protein